jgi:hypothetical protein
VLIVSNEAFTSRAFLLLRYHFRSGMPWELKQETQFCDDDDKAYLCSPAGLD